MSKPSWDAAQYREVASVQLGFGRAMVSRHAWRGDERVLDVGCGTGALAAHVLSVHRGVRLVAVDNDPGMLEQARKTLRDYDRARVLEADVTRLPRLGPFDLVISNAVFHWVRDHDAAFAGIHRELAPGGRLLAQFGGQGNLAGMHAVARKVIEETPFAGQTEPIQDVWNYQGEASTRKRLERAGFSPVMVRLEPQPVSFDSDEKWQRFLRVVTLRVYLHALPAPLHEAFLAACMKEARRRGLERRLDFVRLGVDAIRP